MDATGAAVVPVGTPRVPSPPKEKQKPRKVARGGAPRGKQRI